MAHAYTHRDTHTHTRGQKEDVFAPLNEARGYCHWDQVLSITINYIWISEVCILKRCARWILRVCVCVFQPYLLMEASKALESLYIFNAVKLSFSPCCLLFSGKRKSGWIKHKCNKCMCWHSRKKNMIVQHERGYYWHRAWPGPPFILWFFLMLYQGLLLLCCKYFNILYSQKCYFI